jgi:endonuclease-3
MSPAGGQGSARRKPAATARRSPKRRRKPGPAERERLRRVVEALAEHDPDPKCALDHANAFELLAATILSAQCTDVRVNMVTPELFTRWPTPALLAAADQADVEEVVHSTGFYRNKAKNLIGMAARLVSEHGGEVPRDMDQLLQLPGVARKTANVVRGECFRLADGVVVDTHVKRIAARLGFTRETDPVKVERDLMEIVPREHWIAFSHRLIRLGRTLCPARSPRCEECYLAPDCPKRGVSRASTRS